MKHTTIVEKSEETLRLLIEKALEFEQERVLEGLEIHHYTLEDVADLTNFVKEYHAKLNREIIALAKFAPLFNKQYATENNNCFSTAESLFFKLRNSLTGTMKLYAKFCPKIGKKGPMENGTEREISVFDHSVLSGAYNYRLFGIDSYDESVKVLYLEMKSFFEDLSFGFNLCLEIIAQERKIRKDPNLCVKLYESSCKEIMDSNKALYAFMSNSNFQVEQDEISERKNKATTYQDFAQSEFHHWDLSQFQMHVLNEALRKARGEGLTKEEVILWDHNPEKVKQIRFVIEHFDELNPKGQSEKLSAKFVAMFMKWCGITGTGKEKFFIEQYLNSTYKGKYKKVTDSAVNIAKGKLTDVDYKTFKENIDKLLSRRSNTNRSSAFAV